MQRVVAKCLDCGFDNPRGWITCARCGSLLGPRVRRLSETGSDLGHTTATRQQVVPLESEEQTQVFRPREQPSPPPEQPAPEAQAPEAVPGAPEDAAPAASTPTAAEPAALALDSSAPEPTLPSPPDPEAALTTPDGTTESPAPSAAPPAPPSDARPLVGQGPAVERITQVLQSVFGAAAPHAARLVVIEGGPGSGKTRLLQRAGEIAARLHPDVALHYSALRSRDDGPYAPISRLLLDRFGVTPASSPAVVRTEMEQSVASVLGSDAPVLETTHLLGHVAGVPFPGSVVLRELEPAILHAQAVAAVARLAAGDAAQAPLVWLLDDVTDAQDGAFDLLTALVELDARLLLVVSGQPPLTSRVGALPRSERIDTVVLNPLSEEHVEPLVRALVPGLIGLPPVVGAALLQRSQGNPRQLVELIRALHDGGAFKAGASGVELDLTQLERGGFPFTMSETIRMRLGTLEPQELATLRDAAVVGEHFWEGALLALARCRRAPSKSEHPPRELFAETEDEEVLRRALDALEAKGFVVCTEAGASGLSEYTFQHTAARTLVYEETSEEDRRTSHLVIARWLETIATLGVENQAALLATQLERAGASTAAARAYLRAAADERSRMRTTMALAFVDRALALTEPTDVLARMDGLHQRGSLLTTLGRYDEALGAFAQIVRLAWSLGARGRGGAALNRIARIHRARGENEAALEHLNAALALFEAIGDERGVASCYDDMAQTQRLRGEAEPALAAATAALSIRTRLGDPAGEATSLNTIGRIELDLERFESAQQRLQAALAIRDRLGDHEGATQTRATLGQLAFRTGRVDDAIDLYERALERAREQNNQRFQVYLLSFLGEARLSRGERDTAALLLHDARTMAVALRDQHALADLDRKLAELAAKA